MIREPQLKLTVTNKAVQVEVKDTYHSKSSSMSWSKLRQSAAKNSGYKEILEQARTLAETKKLYAWDFDGDEVKRGDPDLCRYKSRGSAELALFLSRKESPA